MTAVRNRRPPGSTMTADAYPRTRGRWLGVRSSVLRLALIASCLALGGCNRFLREMYDQPKLTSLKTSPLFADGMASRLPPPEAVPHSLGVAAAVSSGRRGTDAVAVLDAADARVALPAQPSAALIARGHERYDIYCAPCHSIVGDGDGPVVRRGYPAPPSYRIERLVKAPDRHFFDVITHGYGIMYSYAGRVDAADRWAIVAYVRQLQKLAPPPLAAASGAQAAQAAQAAKP